MYLLRYVLMTFSRFFKAKVCKKQCSSYLKKYRLNASSFWEASTSSWRRRKKSWDFRTFKKSSCTTERSHRTPLLKFRKRILLEFTGTIKHRILYSINDTKSISLQAFAPAVFVVSFVMNGCTWPDEVGILCSLFPVAKGQKGFETIPW